MKIWPFYYICRMLPSSSSLHLALHSSGSPFLKVGSFLKVCLVTSPWHHWCLTEELLQTPQLSDVQSEYKYFNCSLVCNVRNARHHMLMQRPVERDIRMMRQTCRKSAWKPSAIFHNGIYLINHTKDRRGHCSFCKYQPFVFDKCPWLSRLTQ